MAEERIAYMHIFTRMLSSERSTLIKARAKEERFHTIPDVVGLFRKRFFYKSTVQASTVREKRREIRFTNDHRTYYLAVPLQFRRGCSSVETNYFHRAQSVKVPSRNCSSLRITMIVSSGLSINNIVLEARLW